jgi:hypothetical protein
MRPSVLAALTLALLTPAAPALAHPSAPLAPASTGDATSRSTNNVEHLGRLAKHSGTAGGAPSADGRLFYLTDPRGVYVYDTTAPDSPRLLGSIALSQATTGAALAQEDPDTNGQILLVDAAATPAGPASLHVVDVSDPAALRVKSTVNVSDHTWTCVSGTDDTGAANSCAYAYGRSGHIVDLTDPAAPAVAPGTWRKAVDYGDKGNKPYTHDLTEIRPGLVMSAGSSAILMDTTDPLAPVRLTAIEQPGRFPSLGYHSVEWANEGRDPFLVLGTEIAPSGATNLAGSDCKGENSVIETWDARPVLKALKAYERSGNLRHFDRAGFVKLDAFDAGGRGLFLDGQAPGHVLFCAHWMELSPQFDAGGTMAVSYYDRGTRFVEVGPDGAMQEIGWFTPADGYSGSPQWISDDVVYVMDYRRGVDVIRLKDTAATGVAETGTAPAALRQGLTAF